MTAKPTRILFICHDGDLYGSQRSLALMVRHLPPHYARFVSLARPGPLEALLASSPRTTVLRHKRLQWVKHDARTSLQRVTDAVTLLLSVFSRTLILFRLIRREKIQLVHTNSVVSLEGAMAAAMAGVPHVWHVRELFMERSPKLHMVLGPWLSRRLIDRFSDSVFCISNVVRRQFGHYAENNPQRYPVIFNALEDADRAAGVIRSGPEFDRLRALCFKALDLPPDAVFRIGYVGRLSEGKGFHELLEALHILRRQHVGVELIVAGDFVDEPYWQRIHDLLERYALDSCVRFLGRLADLEPVYAVIDVLAVPSAHEPFGRVVIEAMRYGVPCVATESGGIPEIIEPDVTGLLYPPGHPEILAERVRELLESPWKRGQIRENAGRMVRERFTIEQQVRILDACYQSVLRRRLF